MRHCVGRVIFACVAAVAALAIAAPVLAQDTYYKEMTIEGRIYVFASEPAYRAYEASKELAVGTITRPGYGPNGETVVFDGPRAVEMYNQKHGKTEAPPQEVKTTDVKLPFDIKYRMPGLRITFPKFEMNWVNRMQIRYTYDDQDVDTPQNNKGTFRIRRFRSKWDGWIYTPNLTYELQVDWVGAGITDSTVGFQAGNLQDANLQYDFTGGKKAFMLKAGQFKAPFGRQELTSSGNQEFVDRSIASVLFAPARQIGLQIGGQFGNAQVPDMITYAGGIFNGNGINRTISENDKYEYTGRVMFSPFGNVGYSEANLEHYEFRISVAGDYNNNNNFIIASDGTIVGVDNTGEWGADIAIKALGGLFLYGEYYWRNLETCGATPPCPRPSAAVKAPQQGATAQIGWLFGDHFEIAGRYSFTDLNTDRDDRNIEEWRGAMSWYFNKHFWKLQADYGVTENEAQNGADGLPPRKNKEFRIQAQLMF
jgi:phosphate-selective porin OprO and OprP